MSNRSRCGPGCRSAGLLVQLCYLAVRDHCTTLRRQVPGVVGDEADLVEGYTLLFRVPSVELAAHKGLYPIDKRKK